MGMATGESDRYLGTDTGKWGAEGAGNLVFGLPKGECFFSILFVHTQNAPTFVENSSMGDKHETNIRPLTPDLTSKPALGCWPIHLSPVTREWGGGSGGSSGHYGISLGDIQNAPTRWVWHFLRVFRTFGLLRQNFVPLGGVCVYFLKSVRKGHFAGRAGGGGGGGGGGWAGRAAGGGAGPAGGADGLGGGGGGTGQGGRAG